MLILGPDGSTKWKYLQPNSVMVLIVAKLGRIYKFNVILAFVYTNMNIDKVLVILTAIIKDSKNQVLLIKRSKKSSYPDYWQLVEGKMESGESPEGTITREVMEETKTQIDKLELKSVYHNEIEAKGLKFLCFRIVFNAVINTNNIELSDEHTDFGWFNKKTIDKLSLLPGTKEILDRNFNH